MSKDEEDDFPARGINNPVWMVHAMIEATPARALKTGLRRALELVADDEHDIIEAWDVFDAAVQFAVTGEYFHPEAGEMFGTHDHPHDEDTRAGPMSRDEVDKFLADLMSAPETSTEDDEREDDDE